MTQSYGRPDIRLDQQLALRTAAVWLGEEFGAVFGVETIELEIDGERGAWRKMDNGKDGRPTPGLRPIGAAQDHWRELYKCRRGQVARVDVVREAQGVAERGVTFQATAAQFLRADAERMAALAALLDGARQGSRSEGRTLSRDEMHDR